MTDKKKPKTLREEIRELEAQAEDSFLSIQGEFQPLIEVLDSRGVDTTVLIRLKYHVDALGTLLFSLLIKMHEALLEKDGE